MSNYDLEEDTLIHYQIFLSFIFAFTIFVSILISYNSILNLEKKETLFKGNEAINLLRVNRFISFFVAFGFLYINVCDKKIKKKYNRESVNSDLQVISSVITLIASIIVLYVSFNGDSSIIGNENPEN